mmetsp:Transcript_58098/g.107289  ORF Transcript_58098/g.107289 Transcript_58098/m.107289 type:complete len:396 (-) Transcript_58098:159-1346(-)
MISGMMQMFTSSNGASNSSNAAGNASQVPTCRPCDTDDPKKLFTAEERANDKLVGVVVTISSGSSYDPMFREVQPVTVEGERISTYSMSCESVCDLHSYLGAAATPRSEMWQRLVLDVQSVPADSVVFNWECCSGCGDHAFPCKSRVLGSKVSKLMPSMPWTSSSATMQFMGYAIGAGFTVMCSDYSLKSLIYEWSTEHLGPNPFKIVGKCNQQFVLEFVPQELQNEEVPQQLQVVGELCASEGKAVVRALGNTIAYTVKRDREATDLYDLKVLTVVSSDDSGCAQNLDHFSRCEIGTGDVVRTGSAGHVTLTYRSGGQLVASNGHWIELTRINTSLDAVIQCAQKNYGDAEVASFRQEYATKGSSMEQMDCVQKRAQKMVQQSVSTRMKSRTKY